MYRSLLAVLLYIAIGLSSAVPRRSWDPSEPTTQEQNLSENQSTSGARNVRELDASIPDDEVTTELVRDTPEVKPTTAENPEVKLTTAETPEVKPTTAETPEVARTTVADELEGRSVAQPSPRFYSKLSYFQKNDDDRLLVNLLENKSHRRKFRSKCRCEKISNCPKLQMSVGRCPEEYFMCCF